MLNIRLSKHLVGDTYLYYFKRDSGPFRIVALYNVGSSDDPMDKLGLLHFAEHCLFNKTRKFPNSKLLTRYIREKGAYYNGTTYWNMTEFTVEVPNDEAESAFVFLREVLVDSVIDSSIMEKERPIIKAEIGSVTSDSAIVLERTTCKNVLGSEVNIDTQGTLESIDNISLEDITGCFDSMLSKGPVLVAAGTPPSEVVVGLSNKYFGELTNKASGSEKLEGLQVGPFEKVKSVAFDLGDTTLFSISFRTEPISGEHRYLQSLLAEYLREITYLDLREKCGLVYNVQAWPVLLKRGGYITLQSSCAIDNLVEIVTKLLDFYSDLFKGVFNTLDFDFSRNAYINALKRTSCLNDVLLGFNVLSDILYTPDKALKDPLALERLSGLVAEDLINFCNGRSLRDDISINVLGSPDRVDPLISKLNTLF